MPIFKDLDPLITYLGKKDENKIGLNIKWKYYSVHRVAKEQFIAPGEHTEFKIQDSLVNSVLLLVSYYIVFEVNYG